LLKSGKTFGHFTWRAKHVLSLRAILNRY